MKDLLVTAGLIFMAVWIWALTVRVTALETAFNIPIAGANPVKHRQGIFTYCGEDTDGKAKCMECSWVDKKVEEERPQ